MVVTNIRVEFRVIEFLLIVMRKGNGEDMKTVAERMSAIIELHDRRPLGFDATTQKFKDKLEIKFSAVVGVDRVMRLKCRESCFESCEEFVIVFFPNYDRIVLFCVDHAEKGTNENGCLGVIERV